MAKALFRGSDSKQQLICAPCAALWANAPTWGVIIGRLVQRLLYGSIATGQLAPLNKPAGPRLIWPVIFPTALER